MTVDNNWNSVCHCGVVSAAILQGIEPDPADEDHIGGELLVSDLGTGNYTRDTFNDKRYTLLSTRSMGHNVLDLTF